MPIPRLPPRVPPHRVRGHAVLSPCLWTHSFNETPPKASHVLCHCWHQAPSNVTAGGGFCLREDAAPHPSRDRGHGGAPSLLLPQPGLHRGPSATQDQWSIGQSQQVCTLPQAHAVCSPAPPGWGHWALPAAEPPPSRVWFRVALCPQDGGLMSSSPSPLVSRM